MQNPFPRHHPLGQSLVPHTLPIPPSPVQNTTLVVGQSLVPRPSPIPPSPIAPSAQTLAAQITAQVSAEVQDLKKDLQQGQQEVLKTVADHGAEVKACLHRLIAMQGGEKSCVMAAAGQGEGEQFSMVSFVSFPSLSQGCADFQAPGLAGALLEMAVAGMCTPDRDVL